MAKIPFTLEVWLKDKGQRVETRDGRIVHNIWPVKNKTTIKAHQTEVCALIDGEEDALVFFAGGKYLPVNAENPFDLFIVTPEEELSEFEKAIKDMIKPYAKWPDDIFKEESAKLLSLARKQFIKDGYIIEKKEFHDAVEKVVPEIMKEVSENVDMQIALRTEYEKGREDALKDLPRWKKICRGNNYSSETKFTLNGRYLEMNDTLNDVYEVALSDLEKLPKGD